VNDVWTITSTEGDLVLNPTFSPTQYEPGSIDTTSFHRPDDSTLIKPTGDALMVPAPMTFTGKLWNDARDVAVLFESMQTLRLAVKNCLTLTRSTPIGFYLYEAYVPPGTHPEPAFTSDGLGGFNVSISLLVQFSEEYVY
jgi:hypothetical protein